MMSGSQPMPPEQVAEELEEAEALDHERERAHAQLEAEAMAATARNEAEAAAFDGVDVEKPGLIERLLDLVDGDSREAPAEAEA